MVIHRVTYALGLVVTLLMSASQSRSQTETSKPTALAASAPTSVPALVPYSGTAVAGDGKPLTGESSISFLIFKDERKGLGSFEKRIPTSPIRDQGSYRRGMKRNDTRLAELAFTDRYQSLSQVHVAVCESNRFAAAHAGRDE
jgi:hypothetical protein